jgi:hypothetical protein
MFSVSHVAVYGVFGAVFRGYSCRRVGWIGELAAAGGAPGGSPYVQPVAQGGEPVCRDPIRPPGGVQDA